MATLKDLQKSVQEFCEARDWDQFHTPKDLAIGASTEASELLELFRFKSDAEVRELMTQASFREKMSDEVADIFFFVLRFCQMQQLDLEQSLKNKMAKNEIKYSVQNSKGSNKKYNE